MKLSLKKVLFALVISSSILGGCRKVEPQIPESDPTNFQHTMFLYMVAESNLDLYAMQNVEDFRKAAKHPNLKNGRIVIYIDRMYNNQGIPSTPQMIEFSQNRDGSVRERVLINYPEQNSCDKVVMKRVMNDVFALRATSDSYGMVLWGHAHGWVQTPVRSISMYTPSYGRQMAIIDPLPDPSFITRDYGGDRDSKDWLNLDEIAEVLGETLGGKKLEYLMTDVCLMGGAECAYELRDFAKYYIGSPAEIMAAGMPYSVVAPELFKGTLEGYKAACQLFYDYYNSQSEVELKTATIGLYDCAQLQGLADVMRPIAVREKTAIETFNVASLQHYNRTFYGVSGGSMNARIMFDIEDFVHKLIPDTNDQLRKNFDTQLAKTVLFERSTEWVINPYIKINTHCGMSCYVPITHYAPINEYFMLTDWGKEVYGD